MSVLAVADLSPRRIAPVRRPVGRPRTVRLRPAAGESVSAVTVTITLGTAGSEDGERLLAALRELVAAAGPGADIELAGPALVSAPAPVEPRQSRSGLYLDLRPRTAAYNGQAIDLSRLEYELLVFLARNPRQVFGRHQLLGHVWGHTHTTVRTVDVHVSRLRTKLGDPDIITTVYGIGYRLSEDAAVTISEA